MKINYLKFLFSIFIITGCSKSINKENVKGKWEVINYDSNGNFSTLTEVEREDIVSGIYTFKDNNEYSFQAHNGHITYGTWAVFPEKEKLKLSNEGKNISIMTLKSKQMVLLKDRGTFGLFFITLKRIDE